MVKMFLVYLRFGKAEQNAGREPLLPKRLFTLVFGFFTSE